MAKLLKYIAPVFLVVFVGAFYFLRKPVVNIAYMANAKYLPFVMTSLHSAIVNKTSNSLYNIHLIAKDFTTEDVKSLKQLEKNDVKINIYQAKDLALDYSHLGRFATFQLALQKIFIADYLKKQNKVLYLDADTLVQTDLLKVYQTNIKEKYAAAVKDGLMYQYPEHIAGLKLKDKSFYFNSGVMLLNLDKIRQDNIIQSAIIYFNTHSEVFGDQDILNVVFKNNIQPLSYKYNCNSVFFEEKDSNFLAEFWEENIPASAEEVYKNAAILHFAGHKPWTDLFQHSYLKPLWEKYATDIRTKYYKTF